MRVLLISANTERINRVTLPLGVGLVAAATRQAGHEVRALDLLAATAARSLDLEMLRVTAGIRIYPGTPLAQRALAEGLIGGESELLQPRFYLAEGLAPWIHERIGGFTPSS